MILMLGAWRGINAGSLSWTGQMPNLLKMASAQAKQFLYVVGNWVEWQSVAVFALAPKRQLPWSARDWLGVTHIVAAK